MSLAGSSVDIVLKPGFLHPELTVKLSLSPTHPLSPANAVLRMVHLRKLHKRKSDAPGNVIQNPKYLLILEPSSHKLQRNGESVKFLWIICFVLKLQISKCISIGRNQEFSHRAQWSKSAPLIGVCLSGLSTFLSDLVTGKTTAG